jgi:hypothetical protein
MTFTENDLQNDVSNTNPQPIRVHQSKTYEDTGDELHVPALPPFVFLFSQGFKFEDCEVFARKRFAKWRQQYHPTANKSTPYQNL